jgi:hypothetical protein
MDVDTALKCAWNFGMDEEGWTDAVQGGRPARAPARAGLSSVGDSRFLVRIATAARLGSRVEGAGSINTDPQRLRSHRY